MMRSTIPCLVLFAVLVGCGSTNGSDASADQARSAAPSGSRTVSLGGQPHTFAARYDLLSEEELDAALLGLEDVPVGYSQDPPSENAENSRFCGRRAAEADVKVSREFTKGAGFSTEVINLAISQYKSEQEAKDVFASVSRLFESCHGEMFQGRKLTYALMSVPRVGDRSFGLRITAGKHITYVANYAQVGPVVVTTIGGGYFTVNTGQISELFRQQVSSYQEAAS